MTPKTLDHVALWVEDRDSIADQLIEHAGLHVIERTDRFTLMGADARRFKLTLFEAEGARERGALKHVALRTAGEEKRLELGDGLVVDLVRRPHEVEFDLDHVALWTNDPETAASEYVQLGFDHADSRDGVPRVELSGAFVEFHRGDVDEEPERPLLNHLAVLVERADDAKELPAEVADVVDGPNTYAVFLWGPERVKIEYVEHKPTFALS